MRYILPDDVLKLIDNYKNLSIGPYKINCPYFQNSKLKSFWAVDVGKGLPNDIEQKVNGLLTKIKQPTKKAVVKLMLDNNIGIDCSGLSMRVLDLLLKIKRGVSVRQAVKPSKPGLINLMRHNFRTYTNLSADTLTSRLNCSIVSINNALPGDLIRVGNEHVGIIFEVLKTDKKIKKIRYVHSISGGKNIGVTTGIITIINDKLSIEKQRWEESNGKNYMLNEILSSNLEDSGIRRLNFLSL